VGSLDKSISCDSTQLLRKIDQKMRRIAQSILRNISIFLITEEKFEVHQLLLEISQLLLALQQNPKMAPLAKGLSLQLQNLQEQYNYSFCGSEVKGVLAE
jgi:hypothetical protein